MSYHRIEPYTNTRGHLYASCIADLTFNAINGHCLNEIPSKRLHYNLLKLVDEVFAFAKHEGKTVEDFIKMKKKSADQVIRLMTEGINHKSFKMSSDTFLRWAPMAEEFKSEDEEIMKNSILFRWIEVRRELRSRIKPDLIFS